MRAAALVSVLAATVMLGAASPMPLISYRAQYDVALMPGGTARDIVGVRGRMVTEFRQSCEGYTETQRFIADLTDADETTHRSDFSSTTFESMDGTRFDFNIADVIIGKGAKRYQGKAQTASGGGRASFTTPPNTAIALPQGTLFPTDFSARLIAAAQAGQTSFSATVFHGDDVDELLVASVFIGPAATGADAELGNEPAMRGVRSWPMVVSYHKRGTEEATPDYEMSFRGYENGIATGLRMRYPTFTLQSHLVKLEVLPPSCNHAAATP